MSYFSQSNIDFIQNKLVQLVKANTGITISRQSDPELKIIMKAIYTQYSSKQLDKEEIHRLNKIVIHTAYEQIITGLKQYKSYMYKISNPLQPIRRGINTRESSKTIETNRFM